MKHQPKSLEELRPLRKPLQNTNITHHKKLNRLERAALFVTQRVGTMGFFLIIFIWTVGWLAWNILAPQTLHFDPYPAFVFWLFISNMIQIFLMPLIMVGQNLQGKYSEIRAEADFELNVKTEREIETILQHLENQNEIILKILKHLEKEETLV